MSLETAETRRLTCTGTGAGTIADECSFSKSTGTLPQLADIRNPHIRKNLRFVAAIGTPLLVLATLVGCGGSSSGGANTVTLTLTASQSSIAETSDSSIIITVAANESIASTTRVALDFTGSATRNVDYELSSSVVEIPANASSGSITFTPIHDWELDPNEVATIALGELGGNQIAGTPNSASISLLDGPIPADYKQNISADLRVFADIEVLESFVAFQFIVYNFGAADSSQTQLSLALRTELSDAGTNVYVRNWDVPPLMSNQSYRRTVAVLLDRFSANATYYGFFTLSRTPEETSQRSAIGHDYIGFSLDAQRQIVTRCGLRDDNAIAGTPDPLQSEQWHLSNTGQSAYSESGGLAGADLGMDNTLVGGPFGEGVRVAIVDTGLEQCHPDLAVNAESNASYNFAANPDDPDKWFGSLTNDAFNPHSLGDHGTSVAGIVGSTLENGIGGRGVSPSSLLRGYNFLSYQSAGQSVALGLSSSNPNSAEVDIFNMSYGTIGSQRNSSRTLRDTFVHGTSILRNGLGALYVKSAGNGFNSCLSIEHELRAEIGCRSSTGDSTNNLPYLIVVAGFNADGVKASYSSQGANVWIAAPAGQYGASEPAIITTDQQGTDRGYDVLSPRGLGADPNANALGNYISTFNGTSAAAPMVSGSVAVLLSENPDLTWRDVKHILAATARPIDVEIPALRIAFGGGSPHTFRQGWTVNSAGYWYHNWYGFGAVELDVAIDMAQTHSPDSLGDLQESDWFTESATVAIPDFNSTGVTSTIEVTELPSDATIESVQVELKGQHEFLPDLSFALVSPDGTESILNSAFDDTLTQYDVLDWQLLSNAFYGESPQGAWTLEVVDAARGHRGHLTEWSIRFYYGFH